MADAINAPEKEPEGNDKNSSFDPMSQGKDMMNDLKGMKDAKPGDFMPGKAKNMPTALRVIQILLIIGALLSLIGGLGMLSLQAIWGVLAIVSAVVSLVIVWGINKKAMWAYWLLIVLIAYSVISVLVNWSSGGIFSLVIDVLLLYFIWKSKSWFVPSGKAM